jgi:hypothetical protein
MLYIAPNLKLRLGVSMLSILLSFLVVGNLNAELENEVLHN